MKKVSRITVILLLVLLLTDCYISTFIGIGYGFWQGLLWLLVFGAIDIFIVALIFLFMSLKTLHKEQKDKRDGSHR